MLSKPEVPFLNNNNKKQPKNTPQKLIFSKDYQVFPLDLPVTCMEDNHLSLSVLHKAAFFVTFPVLRMTMKRTSLAFIPLYSGSVIGVELIMGGNAGCIDK